MLRVLRVVVLGLLLALYLAGAVVQGFRVNLDPHRTDQAAYLEAAREMRASGYSSVGDRNRMPVYPFLLSLLYRPGMTDEEFFRRGKAFNIALSVVLLVLVYAVLSKWLEPLAATAIVLVSAFTVFMFKAGYVQCELLFYSLNVVLFVLFIETLLRPTALRAAALGVLAAVTYLTKAAVLPAVLLFLVCSVAGGLLARDPARPGNVPQTAAHLLAFAVAFLIVLFPYIQTSRRVFGRYFYNVNSTFYVWYDSWEDVERGTKAHGDRVGWPDMPARDLPSARRYWRDHTLSQAASRLAGGARSLLSVAWSSYGYFKYAILYLVFLFLYLIQNPREVAQSIRGPAKAALAFVVLDFVGYFVLYSWYAPIAEGNRLILSLFLPGLAAIGYFLTRVSGGSPVRLGRLRVTPASFHRFVLAVLGVDIVLRLPWAITHLSGAD
ncbi:MAG TPA: hypothetical protein VIY96_07580 [Thermoanaerobaculia bacterium]